MEQNFREGHAHKSLPVLRKIKLFHKKTIRFEEEHGTVDANAELTEQMRGKNSKNLIDFFLI